MTEAPKDRSGAASRITAMPADMPVPAGSSVDRTGGNRATPLELFFDLIYVFAFTQVTHLMTDGASLTSVLGGLCCPSFTRRSMSSLPGRDLALRRQVLRTMGITSVPVSVALISGALLGGTGQLTLWLVAVVTEGITVYLTSQGGRWQLPSAAHYAERHGLVVILALGESIISIGLDASHSPLTVGVVLASLVAVVLALGSWWVRHPDDALLRLHRGLRLCREIRTNQPLSEPWCHAPRLPCPSCIARPRAGCIWRETPAVERI